MTTLTPSRFGSLGDDIPLHLPIPGLYADLEFASGSVALTNEFLGTPAKVRVDVLQQWLSALTEQRNSALVDLFREFAEPLRAQSIVEQIDRFRQMCKREGVACPPELAVLLQRF